MPYTAEISRTNPTCFVIVIDQSGSMGDAFGGEATGRKADFVADVVNKTLYDIVIRCTKTEEIRNYYQIAVIGYGTTVQSALGGNIANRDLVPISELADSPARVEVRNKRVPDGAGGLVDQQVRFPIWMDPVAGGGTPMCEALTKASQLVKEFISEHPHSFPPTVLHLTDGESTDGDPLEVSRSITNQQTSDGQCLLFTCHVSSSRARKVEFPADDTALADSFAKTLFSTSSSLPTSFVQAATQIGVPLQQGARGFVFNGDATSVVQFFEIGTRPANLR